MKMTIVLLVVLGLAAAVCAVLLINALDIAGMRSSRSKAEVSVVTANKSLPAMTILTEEVLEIETVKLSEVPQGFFTNPTQVIGKVLSVPMVEGQTLTSDRIVRGGSNAELAATLPMGMRAVSVSLSGSQITGGMLYPGCMVDILVAFSLRGSDKGEALSTTMLERISVLAVQGESVVSKPDPEVEEDTPKVKTRLSRHGLTVTLMVDTKQAEALQLAAMNGQISVTLRNPRDDLLLPDDATVLNRGKLGRLGSLMGTTVKSNPRGGDNTSEKPLAGFLEGEGKWDKSDHSEVMVIRGSEISYDEVEEATDDEVEATEETEALAGAE
jgi:pilus assembly protein CpaB